MAFKEIIGYAAVYDQLSEECDELAKAAKKIARILRGENPTPVDLDEAYQHLVEEFTDVMLCADDLELHMDPEIYLKKYERWKRRLKKAGKIS